jgi:hypothetical protein
LGGSAARNSRSRSSRALGRLPLGQSDDEGCEFVLPSRWPRGGPGAVPLQNHRPSRSAPHLG